jgi:hypothetical protein
VDLDDSYMIFPGHQRGPVGTLSREEGSLLPKKVFAQPFRLAFKKDEDVTWVEVESLAGLRSVTEKLATGELTEIDQFSSLMMQLWGHLAEHTGFLRVKGSPSALAAGIQPLGEEAVALAEDLSAIMGGDDVSALGTLGDMKDLLGRRPIDNTPMKPVPVTHDFVKQDGINLTEKGEDALMERVLNNGFSNQPDKAPRRETLAFEKERENAIEIFLAQTPAATPEEIEAEKAEAVEAAALGELKQKAAGKVITGKNAAIIGRYVAEVGRGLDNADDKAVQTAAQRALSIMGISTESVDENPEVPHATVAEFVSLYGVSVEDLRRLATGLPNQRITNERVTAQRIKDAYGQNQQTADEQSTGERIKRQIKDALETDLAKYLDGSSKAEEEDRSNWPNTDGPNTTYEAPDPRDPYDRKSNDDTGPQQ